MALRALQLGFTARLLEIARPDVGGVEIIPSSTRHLLSELQLGEVLAAVRPGYGMGMLRRLVTGAPEFRDGRALHVERLALRHAVMARQLWYDFELPDVEATHRATGAMNHGAFDRDQSFGSA
jgi:hypothetical protein